ncbi:hypothetical protein BpHYR1_012761 [Brachionus plicatilis]|uniref:Uncharacterized protein n=1 Tax=Brachionus plicatilis TaxID=10195 RepID=A0A3M7STN4_BRAPC|nr:hypothetical protein BpHYR1_012761 [Brachionus plicatilis]
MVPVVHVCRESSSNFLHIKENALLAFSTGLFMVTIRSGVEPSEMTNTFPIMLPTSLPCINSRMVTKFSCLPFVPFVPFASVLSFIVGLTLGYHFDLKCLKKKSLKY